MTIQPPVLIACLVGLCVSTVILALQLGRGAAGDDGGADHRSPAQRNGRRRAPRKGD